MLAREEEGRIVEAVDAGIGPIPQSSAKYQVEHIQMPVSDVLQTPLSKSCYRHVIVGD